jgi:hypothetical protein
MTTIPRTTSMLISALAGFGALASGCMTSTAGEGRPAGDVIAVTRPPVPGSGAGTTTGTVVPPPPGRPATTTTTTTTTAAAGRSLRGYDFTKHVFAPDTCSTDTSTGDYVVRPASALLGDGEVALVGVTYADVARGSGEEALVQVRCQGAKGLLNAFLFGAGASGAPERLAVARPDAAMAARLRDAWDIQDFSLGSARLDAAGHTVVVQGAGYASGDSGCCPSFVVSFELVGHDRDLWAPQGEEVRRQP